MNKDQRVDVDLSPTKEQAKNTTIGREVDPPELRVEQLEERIAPFSCSSGTHIPEAK